MAAKQQAVTYYDAIPAPTQYHSETAELAHEYHRHFREAIPGALFVGVLSVASVGALGWVIVEHYSSVFVMMAASACAGALAIGAAFGLYTWFGFCTLEHERQEKQAMAGLRVIWSRNQVGQLVSAQPLLPAPLERDEDDLTEDEFVQVMGLFSQRVNALGKNGHARSNWLEADGAAQNEVLQLPHRNVEITRKRYERILQALEVRGRAKGRAGMVSPHPTEE